MRRAPQAGSRDILHVIVAGRSPSDRDWVSELLHSGTRRQFEFHSADTGALALAQVQAIAEGERILLAGPVDDMEPLELLAHLTGPGGFLYCPVVVITPGTGRTQGPALLQAGAQDYIGEAWLSPFGLARAIDNALVRWSTERTLRERDAALQSEIADRRRIEGELRLAKQRFEAALSTSPVIVFNQDRSLRYTWIHNVPAGWRQSDFLGRRDTDVLPCPDDGRRALALKRLAMRGAPIRRQQVRVRQGDAERHYDLTLQPQYGAEGEVVGITGAAVDVTEHHRAQVALQASRQQLALAVQVGGLAVTEVDYASRQVHLTTEMARLLGLGDAPMTLSIANAHACIHPDDTPRVRQALADAVDPVHGGGLDLKHRVVRADDGQVRWLRMRMQVQFDGEGAARRAVRAILVALDVTAEHDAAAALQRSEAFVRGVLNSLPQHVLVLDAQGVVQAVNESWERFVHEHGGALAATRVGSNYLEVCRQAAAQGDVGAAEILVKLQDLLAQQAHECVVEYAWQSPWRERWLLMHARRPFHGHELIVSYVDITARKQAEEQLRQAQRLTQTIIDGAGALVFAKDLQGRYFLTNRAWREQVGLDEQQAQGATDERVFGEVAARQVRANDQQVLATGQRIVAEESTSLGGRQVTYLSSKFPLVDDSGRSYAVCGVSTDVTSLKEAQAALQARERELQTLADNSPDILVRFDRQLRHVFANAAIERLTGRAPHEFIGRTSRELGVPPAVCELWEAAIREAFASGEACSVEFDFHSPAGLRHLCGRFVPEFDKGNVAQVLGVLHDDTERQRAEQDLRRREAELRTLADHMSQLAWMAEPDGCLFWVNRRWVDFTGTTAEALRGQGWHSVAHPYHLDRVSARLARCLEAGDTWEDTFPMRRHDGQYRWFLSRAVPVRGDDGQIVRWFGTHTDITEQKRVEEDVSRLLEEERHYAGLLVRMAEASRLVNASLSAEEIARVLTEQAREIIGAHQAVTVLTLEAPGGAPVRAVSLSDQYAECRGAQPHPLPPAHLPGDRPVRLRQADLEQHPHLHSHALLEEGPPLRGWLAVPLTGHAGQPLGLVQLSDRTEGDFTAEDEAILVQLAAIAATGFENALLYASLREADQRKDEFIAILAHELRNPLAPIRNGLEILRRGGGLSGSSARARDMMERQLKHLVRLVDDLLDVSRISRGKVDLRRACITLQSVVESALEGSRPAIDASSHELSLQLPEAPVWVDGDLTRLAQVVSNLLNNAAKYTPAGGRIALRLDVRGAEAVIEVTDNGAGIAPDMLPRIFDLFIQVDHTLSRAQGGLGIGLSLVRQLVALHGGRITVDSAGLGQGSRFTVHLPLVDAPAATAMPRGAEFFGPARPLRILVVDDNVDAAESLATMLRLRGHAVRTAHDGTQGLEAAAQWRPEAVLLDIGMPGLSGLDVARRLRADERHTGMLLVAATGWGTLEDQRQCEAAGFDHHLTKPIDMRALETVLAARQRAMPPGDFGAGAPGASSASHPGAVREDTRFEATQARRVAGV